MILFRELQVNLSKELLDNSITEEMKIKLSKS
jgi:hypothetical protein